MGSNLEDDTDNYIKFMTVAIHADTIAVLSTILTTL